jgi:hypothetical protein
MSIRCQRPQGPLSIVCGVSIDASLHGGSNDTIGSRVRHRRPEILRFFIRLCPRSKQKLAVVTTGGRAVPDFESEVIGNLLSTLERGFHRLIIQ